jgi:MbtH protein
MASRTVPIAMTACLTGLLTTASAIAGAEATSLSDLPSLMATTNLAQSDEDEADDADAVAEESDAPEDEEPADEPEEESSEGEEDVAGDAESSAEEEEVVDEEQAVEEEQPADEEALDSEDAGDEGASDGAGEASEPASEAAPADAEVPPAETAATGKDAAAQAPEPTASAPVPMSPTADVRSGNEGDDGVVYRAVMNQEEQYSIWPVAKELPLGWQFVGEPGTKGEVLAFIEEAWNDMRPLSLRKKMAEMERGKP